MYVTGPDVVKKAVNEDVSHEELGGWRVHALKSGVSDGAFENDLEALAQVRRLVDFLPLSNREPPPHARELRRSRPRGAVASTPWCRPTPTSPTT